MLVRTHHTKCTNMSAGSGVERGCSGQDAHWSPSWDNSNVLKPLTSATTSCGSMRWTNRMPKSREWWVGWLASCSLRRKGGETRGSKGGWGGEKGEVRREKWGGREKRRSDCCHWHRGALCNAGTQSYCFVCSWMSTPGPVPRLNQLMNI